MVSLEKIQQVIDYRRSTARQLELELSGSTITLSVEQVSQAIKELDNLLSRYSMQFDGHLYELFSDPSSKSAEIAMIRSVDETLSSRIDALITKFVKDVSSGGSAAKLSKTLGNSIRKFIIETRQKKKDVLKNKEQSVEGSKASQLSRLRTALERQEKVINQAYVISQQVRSLESELNELRDRRFSLINTYGANLYKMNAKLESFGAAKGAIEQAAGQKEGVLNAISRLIRNVSLVDSALLKKDLESNQKVLGEIEELSVQINKGTQRLIELKNRINQLFDEEFAVEIPSHAEVPQELVKA